MSSALTIEWNTPMPLDSAIHNWRAEYWRGLYFITRNRGSSGERPIYIGISDADNGTIGGRLSDHKNRWLSPTQGPYYVRLGHILNQINGDDFHPILLVTESALIRDLLKKGYKMHNTQLYSKYSEIYQFKIYNKGDKGALSSSLDSF